MAVRRLHPDQPPSFAFNAENLAWIKETIAKYPPGKQASAVIPVLWRAQEQHGGWLPEPAIRNVADMLGMAYIRVYEVATFYTMFQLAPVGTVAHIQVCGTTPCMLRGSQDLIEACKKRIHPDPHHVSADGKLSWEEVECLGSCANAPMVQIWKDTYEDLTPELLERVIDGFVSGNPPKPGSQTGRTASCPSGGQTSLKDPSLFDGSRIGAWQQRFAETEGLATAGAANDAAAKAAAAGATPAASAATVAPVPATATPPSDVKAAGTATAAATAATTAPAPASVTAPGAAPPGASALASGVSGPASGAAAGVPTAGTASAPAGSAMAAAATLVGGATAAAQSAGASSRKNIAADSAAAAAARAASVTTAASQAKAAAASGASAPVAAAAQGAPATAAPAGTASAPAKAAAPSTGAAPAPTAAAAPSDVTPSKPALLTAARDGGKGDDLGLIWGVGDKLHEKLNAMGIWHFDQIAAWTPAEVAWFEAEMQGFKGRIERDKWIEQCKKLASGWRPDHAAGERPKG